MKAAPKDRSIFRKNIGRALLNKKRDEYLDIWEIDFTPRGNRERYGHLRDIQKEKAIESDVTRILRENFSFRFTILDSQIERMGGTGLESSLIGTVACCVFCRPSNNWLGNYSPNQKIKGSGLWLVQHLMDNEISEKDKLTVSNAIMKTKEWVGRYKK